MKNKTLSVCYIVKNEADVISRSLSSVKSIADEIIIIDTGCSDNTIEIARTFTHKIHTFDWTNDFSAARNFALSKATKEWVIFFDADEYINEENSRKLKETLNRMDQKWEAILFNGLNITEDESPEIINSFSAVRCFKNTSKIKYTGKIHESIKKKGKLRILDCTDSLIFYHTGYSEKRLKSKNKHERNLKLLFEELEESPDNGNILYYIGQQYYSMQDFENAQIFSKKGIEKGVKLYDKEKVAYVTYISSCLKLKNISLDAVMKSCREGLEKYPNFSDLNLLHSECLLESADINGSILSLENYIMKLERREISFKNANFNENILVNIHRTLGNLYYKKKNYSNSVIHLVKVLKIQKSNVESLKILIRILHQRHSGDEVRDFMSNIYHFDNVQDLFSLAKVYAELGNSKEVNYYKSLMLNIRSVGGSVK